MRTLETRHGRPQTPLKPKIDTAVKESEIDTWYNSGTAEVRFRLQKQHAEAVLMLLLC